MTDGGSLAVSVLLPAYFREVGAEDIRLLRRALHSIREQHFRDDYEVLILDDGSTTPVEQLAPHLGDENLARVRFVRSARNQGLVHALNRGLAEARFPLIARLDADDRWLPTKIRKQLDLMAADPDLTITATGMTAVTPQGRAIETDIRPGDWSGVLGFFTDVGCPFPHGSVVARREIYTLLGGYPHDPASRHCEDYSLWGIWLRFFKPGMVEEALYNYTISAHSVTAIHREQQRRASEAVKQRFRNLDLVRHLPRTLAQLAAVLGCSVLEAGVLAYRIWRFRLSVRLPPEALNCLRLIMPDRHFVGDADWASSLGVADVLRQDRALQADQGLVAIRAV